MIRAVDPIAKAAPAMPTAHGADFHPHNLWPGCGRRECAARPSAGHCSRTRGLLSRQSSRRGLVRWRAHSPICRRRAALIPGPYFRAAAYFAPMEPNSRIRFGARVRRHPPSYRANLFALIERGLCSAALSGQTDSIPNPGRLCWIRIVGRQRRKTPAAPVRTAPASPGSFSFSGMATGSPPRACCSKGVG